MLDAEGDINSEALLKDADFLATREKVVAKLKELAEAKKAPQQPAAPASENTAIELINKKLKSIKGDTLGFSPKVAPGTFKYTEDGTKVTLIKSQRDKYGRGEEVFNITYPDGDTTSVTVDYKQRPTNGWSDSKELPFDAKYSENPKSLFDELNALSNSKIKAPKTSDVKTEIDPNKFKGTGGDDDYKLVGVDPDKSQISAFDLAVLKQWHANNVPNIPYEVLENVINTHDNEKAFGVFQDGVAKFYRMATRGTEYHELFHGIFNGFLSESEREALKEEFKSNRGTFTERNTGKQIKYVDATDKQAEEKIADDFGEFRKGKMAAKSFGQKILDFFKSIINFIKSFVTKPSLKEKLFKDINTGKFKKAKLTTTDIEPLYSKVEGMSASQVHEAVQDMVIRASGLLFGESVEDIYSFKKLAGNEVFDKIEADYIKSGKRQLITDSAWNDLVKRTRDSLRTIVGLKFNDEEIADINNENVSNREYDRDPFSIGIKESSFGMKLLIGTLPATSNKSTLGRLPERKKSNNFDGFVLLPTSRTYPTMLNALANTSDVNLAIKKLGDLAKNDPNYVRVVDKLNGNTNDMTIDQNTFKPANWRLFIDFYQTFTKQRPEVFAQYTNGNEVYVGAANLYDASAKLQRGWLQNMRDLAKTEGALIKFNSKSENKTYDADPKAFANTSIDGTVNQLNFLNKLGVDITADTFTKLSNKDQKRIGDETNFIYEHLKNKKALASLKDGTLDVKGRFKTIADIIVKATNPLQDSTYNGVDGKMRQTNCQNNALSLFANRFNESASLQELKQNRPELNDPFCENSVILRPGGRFFDKEGVKIEGQELRVGLISGDLDELKDKGRSITRLSLGKRFSTEINQNLNGNFYAINPADSASEWQMNFGNEIPFTDIRGGIWDDIHFIFRGYLIDDVALALDYKKRQKLANVGKKAKELRFFKDILSEKNLEAIDDMIAKKTTKDEIVKYIDTNISKINEDVTKYLQDSANNLKKVLIDNTQISVNKSEEEVVETTYNFKSLENKFADVKEHRLDKFNLSEQDLNDLTLFNDVNKTIANIEYHKTLFGDPYQFAIKEKKGKIILEETKRIKSFDSPAETTFNSPEFNNFHNLEYNKTGLYGESNRIELAPRTDETPGDPGSDVFKDYMNTVTMNDMDIVGRVMGKTTENDASSIIRDNAYRQVKLRNRKWDDDAELFHQWNMSYTRNKLAAKGDYTYTSDDLKAYDAELIKTPEPPFVTEISKPIVRGNKYGSNTIDLILDKTSQMPLYYKMVEKSTLADLYIKMWKEDVDYVIAQSGRKLGSEEVHQLYVGGKFNNAPFNNNIKVPWSAYGIQVETDYDDKRGKLTAAVQVPKIVSMDLFEHGVPFTKDALRADVIQKEYQRGVNIKKALVDNGYNNLLDKLGLVDNGGNFDVVNRKKLAESLYYETLRTEVSDNIKDALTLDENGEFIIPFEATFAYKKIKDIIYSMLDKSIGHPKTNGGSYIQAPVTMWEDSSKGRRIAIKTDQGYKELSRAEYDKLPENRKGDVILTDDTLHFPTESDPYTGVRLPHWFGEKIKNNKRFDTDEKVLNYLNNTIEGQEILRAVGFRIPATEMASLEAIRVESFLPKQFGKTIIVPSEITTKQGSDFDVDKLNMYLKNVYIDKNNDLKLVRYQGSEKATKDFFGKVFDDILQNKKVKKAELLEASQILSYDLDDPKGLVDRYSQLLDVLLKDVSDPANFEESIMQQLEKLGDDDIQSKLKEEFIKDHYQASLENEYYDHLEKMITLPENFKALTTAVDDAGLSKLANELDDLRGRDESTIKNRVINGTYLTQTRHAFAMAKDWMGIVASNIAAHSIAQKGKVVIDPAFFENIDSADKKILGDGSIKIPHNTVDGFPTISGVKTVDGKQFISKRLAGHGTAIVDVAKDPYILKIIMSNLAPSSVMFLERIGTGETGLMLLAQPIVEKYLTYIDNIGASSLYSLGNINLIKSLFPTTEEALEAADTINVDKFDENIRKFYAKGEELSNIENAEQHLILDEVLKYAKMSDYLSDTNQALTYDTAKFSNGEALSKKQYRTKRALENNIFRGVEQLLDNTFLGNQAEVTDNGVNAIGEILKLESRPFTAITNQVLAPYMQNKYMKGDDFNAIGNRIKLSFLDFIVQTRANINEDILPLIADTETSIASQLARAKEEHPTIQILQDLESTNNAKVDGPKSVKLKANISGDAAAENIYIGMMRELRDNPSTTALYNNLVKVAILQGMYKSPISLGNIIPIEDFSKHITPIISTLNADGDLENFTKGWFQRNNFKDPTVFTKIEPKFNVAQWSRDEINRKPILYESNNPKKFQYFPSEELLNIVSTSRHILTLSDKFNYLATKSDYVQFPRVVEITRGKKPTGQFVDAQTGQAISKYEMSQYKAKGSDFHKDLYNYERVKDVDGKPFFIYRNGEKFHVYKLINVYGDGNVVSEYYNNFNPSRLNNGSIKVPIELTDEQIRSALAYKSAPAAPIELPVVKQQVVESIIDQGQQADIEPEYGLTKENFEYPEGYDEAMSNQPKRTILESRQTPINYTSGQIKALNQVGALIDKNEQAYYLLAGYAGTGKTTIAENIANYAKENGRNVVVIAPTNKAAKVLNDKLRKSGVGVNAATIHKTIYGELNPVTGEWIPNKTNLKNAVVLVDESSMIAKDVMKDLIANTKQNNIVVFMGDSFQLEPVGQGQDPKLFAGGVPEILNSQSQLTEVKRQGLDSNILKIATLARMDNKGYVPMESMPDFKVSKSRNEFINDFKESIKNDENSIMIVATNNERITMNDVARMTKFGPDRKILNDGETLIAVANSSDIPNSDIFKAVEVRGEPSKHELTFDFNGKISNYNMYFAYVVGEDGIERKVMHFPGLDRPSLYHSQILASIRIHDRALFESLDNGYDIINTKKGPKLSPAIVISTYGYSVTAHKSQGSQWDKVFVNQNYNSPSWNPARWYYTAITRSAKDLVVLPSASNIRIKNADVESKINAIAPEEKDVSSQANPLNINEANTEGSDNPNPCV
jgi:energy-coupling factor transporter ATP-binding protein EcfA2